VREKNGWFQSYTGRKLWVNDPRPEDICIDDVAGALSHICRFGGHVVPHYSVAQHCVLVSRLVPPELALAGLLHDASEAYLGDVIRPLKRFVSGYAEIEEKWERAIGERFGVTLTPMDPIVKCADHTALSTEVRDLMYSERMRKDWEEIHQAEPPSLKFRIERAEEHQFARVRFLNRFAEILHCAPGAMEVASTT
jgi:uncharacterized protein